MTRFIAGSQGGRCALCTAGCAALCEEIKAVRVAERLAQQQHILYCTRAVGLGAPLAAGNSIEHGVT